ncbi:MAG: SDR family oxidoreductase [Actinobacteria bacterium]|nr:SDR family oxidoreductase [Actinomycetota bacterium]
MSIPIPDSNGTCLITGASSGIGEELARQIAERGYNVTLAARRIDRLAVLAAEIEREYDVTATAVECDVTDPAAREALLAAIAANGKHVDVLVNNAGCGTDGPFAEQSAAGTERQLDLNITALTMLTHAVLPGMIERRSGAILNVASTAAFQPIPRQAVYAASKSYVLSFSNALGKELAGTGVSVTTLCPGPTKTEFFGPEDMEKYTSSTPGMFWQTSAECARDGVDGLFKRKRVVIPKAVNRIGAFSGAHTPTSVTLEVLDRFWPVGKEEK